eukprot:m.174294 g.174294  ORF g.174294 m.174294 type:complete len:144 (-) comp13814_c0_seq1:2749-3180(-)
MATTASQAPTTAVPTIEPAGLETPSMKAARLKWEERQKQRLAERAAKQAAGETVGPAKTASLSLDTTLVTESMGSNEEEAAFNKTKSCVSGQSKATRAAPGKLPNGYKDGVERTFQYDAEKAIKTGKTTTRRSYAVVKPYFQY